MRKRQLSTLLVLCMVLALLPGTALAADSPASTHNIYYNDYCSIINSYLYENESGGLTRVEYANDQVIVEEYDSSFKFLSGQTIPKELDIWGGFFAGETYNFLIFGQKSQEEDNTREVIRVVKYSKSWQRLGQASLHGVNITVPFVVIGSLRAAEYDGELYIRTCREMYTSSDGLNHQSNLSIAIRESDMKVLDAGSWDVSHSFNQFVLVDQQQRIVTLDHGDANPRSAVLKVYDTKAGHGKFSGSASSCSVQRFPGQFGDNHTGASLGGLAETNSGYVVAYNYDGKGSSVTITDRSVYFAYVNKDNLHVETKVISSVGTQAPVLVPTSLNGGYILWNGTTGPDFGSSIDTLYYIAYTDGGSVGTVRTATAPLSDCQPIVYNGKVVWYTTGSEMNYTIFNTFPTFYQLDEHGVTAIKTRPDASGTCGDNLTWVVDDLIDGTLSIQGTGPMDNYSIDESIPWSHYRSRIQTVIIDDGVSNIGESAFQWCNRLTSVAIPDSVTSIGGKSFFYCTSLTDVYYGGSESQWKQIETPIVKVPSLSEVASAVPLMFATIHYNSTGPTSTEPETPSIPAFTDVPANAYYADAVAWAVVNGITSGTGSGTFSPESNCTRAQIVTFLWRAADSPTVNASNPFKDVAESDYYYNAVLWAVQNGITSGTSTTTFSPNDTCTRAQAVTFLYRAKNSPTVSGSNSFTDLTSGAYYINAVQWAVNTGVTSGTSSTTFSPDQTCTRAQIVTFLYRDRAN